MLIVLNPKFLYINFYCINMDNSIFGIPVEECKKRWRGLRDGYTRSKRMGTIHRSKVPIFEKLQFLDSMPLIDSISSEVDAGPEKNIILDEGDTVGEEQVITEQTNVITDNQEYYEVCIIT